MERYFHIFLSFLILSLWEIAFWTWACLQSSVEHQQPDSFNIAGCRHSVSLENLLSNTLSLSGPIWKWLLCQTNEQASLWWVINRGRRSHSSPQMEFSWHASLQSPEVSWGDGLYACHRALVGQCECFVCRMHQWISIETLLGER